MISLNPLKTEEQIRSLLEKEQDIYNAICVCPADSIDLVQTMWYEVLDNRNKIGIFIIKHFAGHCLVFHGGLFNEFRHKNTVKFLHDCLELIKRNYPEVSLITTINDSNQIAVKLIEHLGFKLKMSIPKAGKDKNDILVYGEL